MEDVGQEGEGCCLMSAVSLPPLYALPLACSFPAFHLRLLPFHPSFAEQLSHHSASFQSLRESCPPHPVPPILFLLSPPSPLIPQLVTGDLVPFQGSNSIHAQFFSLLIPTFPSVTPALLQRQQKHKPPLVPRAHSAVQPPTPQGSTRNVH